MNEQGVGAAELAAHLADGFQKRQRFDVAHRAADFHNGHVFIGRAFVDTAFDFVGDVRNHLHRAAQIVAAPLFGNHVFIHLPGAEAVGAGELGVDEAFVVAEVEIGFRAVFGYEHLAMLERAHRAGIHVDIRIQLKHSYIQPARFEDGGNRSGGDTFP